MRAHPVAQGRRVVLRRVVSEDCTEFTALARASADLHRPWIHTPATPEEFADYLARFDGVQAVGLVACLRDTGAIAGLINISQIVRGPYQRGTLGYGAFAATAGRGYMAEGLGLVLGYAFGELGLHRLEADIQPGNEASRGLVARLGFRLEGYSPGLIRIDGIWRDHERWAVTAEMADTATGQYRDHRMHV
ncbi:RimJ/RimL family protein N-acetyltransferase [Actinomadura craniellae]|uniref:RimJ/RimL family protein N-acetyltransferase n=1 Tax=Actinomadura craniellae TaxID=2231787 RepID=A0A365H3L6_9ACTN|nr:GNAT family N-acetyltransferase [Actinomadura craniellae]RAY12813.1 RimJ/RimL family protein N-acetyltransferase [Actinomadura craniellae]